MAYGVTNGAPQVRLKIPVVVKIFGVLILAFFLFSIFKPFEIISPGHRGVVIQLGAVKQAPMNEGFNWKIPLIQNVEEVNVQTQKTEATAAAASKDMQNIVTKIAVNFNPSPASISKLYQTVGLDYGSKIIDPAVHEVVKAVTARYTAEELITKRQIVATEIQQLLSTRLAKSDIIVTAISIVDFQFSKEFNNAIEAKQTAEQLALKAKWDLNRIKVEAEQKVAAAQAEADALRAQKEQVTPELIQLRQIEVQKAAVEKWNGVLPTTSAGGAVPFLNIK